MFFSQYPNSLYKISDSESTVVTDFIRSVSIDPVLKENSMYYTLYTAMDNETPEMISHRNYGSVQYHWIIILLNEKFDPFSDYPKSDDVLRSYAKKQYGSVDGIHHYADIDGIQVDDLAVIKYPVTNYEYLVAENEKKRQIKILRKEMIPEFISMYSGAINE